MTDEVVVGGGLQAQYQVEGDFPKLLPQILDSMIDSDRLEMVR